MHANPPNSRTTQLFAKVKRWAGSNTAPPSSCSHQRAECYAKQFSQAEHFASAKLLCGCRTRMTWRFVFGAHPATRGGRARFRADLRRHKPKRLRRSAERMAEATLAAWKEWKSQTT